MANVQDVARFFIGFAQEQAEHYKGDLMTNLRLQKMLYFAQGYHLAQYGKPLFDDEIEMRHNGPFVPVVYNVYSKYGSTGISEPIDVEASCFDEDEYSSLLYVVREYDYLSTLALIDIAFRKCKTWDREKHGVVIPKDEIYRQFSDEKPAVSF